MVRAVDALPEGELPYYASVVMLAIPDADAGAKGTGGHWAAATAAVNRAARARIRRACEGRPAFEVQAA